MTRLQNLVALSTALQTCHADAKEDGQPYEASDLRNMGMEVAVMIANLIRNSRETQGEGVGK